MFGQLPMSRWKHSMVATYDDMTNEAGFMIFGGANLNCYCRSAIFSFTLIDKSSEFGKRSEQIQKNKEDVNASADVQG